LGWGAKQDEKHLAQLLLLLLQGLELVQKRDLVFVVGRMGEVAGVSYAGETEVNEGTLLPS